MERTYSSLGIPLVFDGLFGFFVAAGCIFIGIQTWGVAPPWSVAFLVLGAMALTLGVLVVLQVPTRLHIRDNEFGFSTLRGSTEWFRKSDVSARITRHGMTSRGWKVLRFDTRPRKWRLVPYAYDVSMLMTDDGMTIRWSELEQVLGIPVNVETFFP